MSRESHRLQDYEQSKREAVTSLGPGEFEIQVRPRDREGRVGLTIVFAGARWQPIALWLSDEDVRFLLEDLGEFAEDAT